MATALFTPCAGGIAKIELCSGDGGDKTFNVNVEGASITLPTTGFILEMQGNYQFLHALDQFIYYYNFGDRVGELTVSGLGFAAKPCGNAADNTGDVCQVYKFYEDYKQSKYKKALKVGADSCGTFWAFLTGMRIEMSANSYGVPLGQWSLRFHVIPKRVV